MPQVKEYVYPGSGEANRNSHWYSSAIRVGALVECAGQGGMDPNTSEFIYKDINKQTDQAFENVELALKSAGSKGWSQVIKITSYHTTLDDTQQDAMVRNFKKWMPHNHPPWTCVEVTRLGGGPLMNVEIQVTAWDEEGADK